MYQQQHSNMQNVSAHQISMELRPLPVPTLPEDYQRNLNLSPSSSSSLSSSSLSSSSSSAASSSAASSSFSYSYYPYHQTTSSPYYYNNNAGYNYYSNVADSSFNGASLSFSAKSDPSYSSDLVNSPNSSSNSSSNSSLNAYWRNNWNAVTSSAPFNYYEPSSSALSCTNQYNSSGDSLSSYAPASYDEIAEFNTVSSSCSYLEDKQELVAPTEISPAEHPTESRVRHSTKLSRKHQLPDRAVDIMNEWFDEHKHNPYPQMHEKELMAQRGGISIKQVTAWFSNRRNRSQNTKPKRMQRVIKDNFSKICQEIAFNPDRHDVAEKVRQFQETLEKRY